MHRAAVDPRRTMAGVGPRARIEFERTIRGAERLRQLRRIERHGKGAGVEHVPVAAARQTDGRKREIEPPGNEQGKLRDRVAAVGGQQDVANLTLKLTV